VAAVIVLVLAWVGTTGPTGNGVVLTSLLLGVVFLVATAAVGRLATDTLLTALLGLAACLFALLAGLHWDSHGEQWPAHLAAGAVLVVAAAGVLLVCRQLVAPRVSATLFGAVAVAGLVTAVGGGLHQGYGMSPGRVGALLSVVFLALVITAPRLVIRMARLQGPQLPRTSADLQLDVEPLPAKRIAARTATADGMLTVVVVVAALLVAATGFALSGGPGWAGPSLVALFAVVLLFRARVHTTVWQRLFLIGAGVVALARLVVAHATAMGPLWNPVVVFGLLLLLLSTVLVTVRPASRRSRPIWAHLGNILETLSTVAVLPVALQVLGTYAWARGLAG
jgi:type VII secretion integral membrane protein EccD